MGLPVCGLRVETPRKIKIFSHIYSCLEKLINGYVNMLLSDIRVHTYRDVYVLTDTHRHTI